VQLTEPQQRTWDRLIVAGSRPAFPADLPQRLRDRIEGAVRELELSGPLWLGKDKLKDHGRCEGTFLSKLLEEAPPFSLNARSAAGTLLHKAVEAEVGAKEPVDPHGLAELATRRLMEREERFAEYWTSLEPSDRDEIAMETVRRIAQFQASFPPLREFRRELVPMSEFRVKAEFLGGDLVVSGQIDLVLGSPDPLDPTRATRIAIDLKTSEARPEYVEDLRLYALLLTLRFGVPPFRTASLFLDSGEWQPEDVTDEVLVHAADRVIAAARSAASLMAGAEPDLRPGPWCGWCPRAEVCPAADPTAA
jgi:PD-(D/E)XK nuclease superfamily protein